MPWYVFTESNQLTARLQNDTRYISAKQVYKEGEVMEGGHVSPALTFDLPSLTLPIVWG